jgi:tRNA threonylcarbamoyladenosine biosynthesis protein TsaB
MTGILAVDTATDACSVAVSIDGKINELHEVIPRQHSQRLFGMLAELLSSGDLRSQGIGAIAYGRGPGSFTGLRIAASAVQGLAYANELPAVAISSLACQAQTALRLGLVNDDAIVLSTMDARINEIYAALYTFKDGIAALQAGPWACAPSEIPLVQPGVLFAVGSGCRFHEEFPAGIRDRLEICASDLLPAARDLIPLALDKLARGDIQSAQQVQPVYVRDEISWKKLSEQGKSV